ncbi:rutC family protein in vnfA 5'region [Anaerolineaceae bacterium]|nr:rutC family protein in vnfA 5'region [Anaerolineaceae bacterium]
MNSQPRRNISTNTPWETRFGYSRVVVAGGMVFVAGTVAADHTGRIHAPGNAAAQARYIYEKIGRALEQAGASLRDVVRVRVYLTNIADIEAVGQVHHEFFADVRPVNTTLAVAALAAPECLLEIEVDAVLPLAPL